MGTHSNECRCQKCKEKINELLKIRKPFYHSAFDIKINTSRLSIEAAAEKIIEELLENKVELVTSNYIVDECSTMLRVKCGLKKAMLFREYILNSKQMIKIYRVSVSDEKKAWEIFLKYKDKDFSYTDCTSFAVIFGSEKEYRISALDFFSPSTVIIPEHLAYWDVNWVISALISHLSPGNIL